MKKIAILTSGGDSPGMNPVIRSVTRTAINKGMEVWGIQNGYQGLLDNDFVQLDVLKVSGKGREPGTFLQTSRCLDFIKEEGQNKAMKILEAHGIEGLVVVGGDGSLTGALALQRKGLQVVGIPGTIDNDLYGTEMSVGVDTCLNTIMHLVDMIRATAASHRRCFVVEVMGRASGYLALMTAISTGAQVAVVPEFKLNMDNITRVLERRFARKHNNSVIIIAEGVCSGAEFLNRMNQYPKGTIQQDIRLTVLGHVQRGGVPTHFDRLLGARMGEMAVLALESKETGTMVAQVGGKMQLIPIENVIGKKRALSGESIRTARNLGIEIGDAVEM